MIVRNRTKGTVTNFEAFIKAIGWCNRTRNTGIICFEEIDLHSHLSIFMPILLSRNSDLSACHVYTKITVGTCIFVSICNFVVHLFFMMYVMNMKRIVGTFNFVGICDVFFFFNLR